MGDPKALDRYERWRSKTVAFRMSPEENDELHVRVRLSGLTKQEYIIRKLLEKDIVVTGNPRVHRALKQEMDEIIRRLDVLAQTGETMEPEFWETIQLVTMIMAGMAEPLGHTKKIETNGGK